MAMPLELILVRHGESEANIVHKQERTDSPHPKTSDVYERPDWLQRLSAKGVSQAKGAGEWLKANGLGHETFARCYASTFMRARETALHIGGDNSHWLLDDRLKERDWGEFGATPKDMREAIFPHSFKSQQNNKWYARYNGGESLADNVLMRARDFIGTLHRDMANSRVMVVSHGEFMMTMRYLIERMLPEEWLANEEDAAQNLRNCSIIHYSRIDPNDSTNISAHISWMRIIYPDDENASPYGGKWQRVSEKRFVSAGELSEQIKYAPNLIED
jgi:broad specificity phosphatase PhoE